MRYLNGGDSPRIGLVGKGIVYDSGGYSIKTTPGMKNMFDDMGGAAAVIGAMTAVADQKLKANVIGVIPDWSLKHRHNYAWYYKFLSSINGLRHEKTHGETLNG